MELGLICWGGSIEEVEVERGDGRTLQSGPCSADENRFELSGGESVSNLYEEGSGIHDVTFA